MAGVSRYCMPNAMQQALSCPKNSRVEVFDRHISRHPDASTHTANSKRTEQSVGPTDRYTCDRRSIDGPITWPSIQCVRPSIHPSSGRSPLRTIAYALMTRHAVLTSDMQFAIDDCVHARRTRSNETISAAYKNIKPHQ